MTHLLNTLAPGAGAVGLLYAASRACLWGARRIERRRDIRRLEHLANNPAARNRYRKEKP